MSKFMVNLSSDPSKAEEVNALGKIAAKVPANSYLKILFTQSFVDWFSEQVRWDYAPDMFGNWQADLADASSRMKLANAAVRDAEIMQRRLERKVEELETALDEANGKADRLAVALSDERSAFDRSATASDERYQRMRNTERRLRSALTRMRKVGADREAKWAFLLKKIRS